MTWFIPVLITFTFTVAVGIVGHITTARGHLLQDETIPRYYSDIELVRSDITVMRSTGDMSTTGRIMTDDSTVLSSGVKGGDRARRKEHQTRRQVRLPAFCFFNTKFQPYLARIGGFTVPDNQQHVITRNPEILNSYSTCYVHAVFDGK